MKLNTSMLFLMVLLNLIVWISSNHINLKAASGTVNTLKNLIKNANSNELELKNKNNLGLKSQSKNHIKQNYFENAIHKESKQI